MYAVLYTRCFVTKISKSARGESLVSHHSKIAMKSKLPAVKQKDFKAKCWL